MLAKVETWVSVLIFIIWAFSAYLEYQRKKKKKAEAEAQQRKHSSDEQGASAPWSEGVETLGDDPEVLRRAEEAAKSQPYRSSRRGEDLEVSVEDLLKEILLPDPLEAPPEKLSREKISEEKLDQKFLESELPSAKDSSFQEVKTDFEDEIRDAPSDEEPMQQWSRDSIFSQGFSQAILAAEILSEPRSRKVFSRRF